MDTKEIANFFVTAIGKIELYWNFYTLTMLALIGWLVSMKKDLGTGMKLLITVGYLLFAIINLIGLWISYTLAEALRQDLLVSAKATPEILKNTRAIISEISYDSQRILAFVVHVIFGVFVLSVVWFGALGEKVSNTNNIE
jgi:hypothetical protein